MEPAHLATTFTTPQNPRPNPARSTIHDWHWWWRSSLIEENTSWWKRSDCDSHHYPYYHLHSSGKGVLQQNRRERQQALPNFGPQQW